MGRKVIIYIIIKSILFFWKVIAKVFITYIVRPQGAPPNRNLIRKELQLIIEIIDKGVLPDSLPNFYTITTLEKYIKGITNKGRPKKIIGLSF